MCCAGDAGGIALNEDEAEDKAEDNAPPEPPSPKDPKMLCIVLRISARVSRLLSSFSTAFVASSSFFLQASSSLFWA